MYWTSRQRHAGTAMIEMVLILPLLFVVLSLLIYLGRGVVRVQRAMVMDRYEAWHQAAHAPGPGIDNPVDSPHLNQLFYGDNADEIVGDVDGGFSDRAVDQLFALAYAQSASTGALAQRHVNGSDTGLNVAFRVEHTTGNQLWQRFDGPIRHDHTRIGHDWAYVNGWNSSWERVGPYSQGLLEPVRDVFLSDFDASLAQVAITDNDLAAHVRSMYLAEPGYVGPDFDVVR